MTKDTRNMLLSWIALALALGLVAVWTGCTRTPEPITHQLDGPWKRSPRRIPENAGIHRDGGFRGKKVQPVRR